MFSGIGGFRAGLDRAGGFECIGHCERDKYADASYRAMHNIREEEVYYPDARSIDPAEMPEFQLLCGGFPCQSYPEKTGIEVKRLEALRCKASRNFLRDNLFAIRPQFLL